MNRAAKMESGYPLGKFPAFNEDGIRFSRKISVIIGTIYQIDKHVDNETLEMATVIIDEAGMASWEKFEKIARASRKLIIVGDKNQLQPFEDKISVTNKLEKFAELTISLTTTYRLNQATVTFLKQVYPRLLAKFPNQYIEIENVQITGILGLPFNSNTKRKGTSCIAVNEAELGWRIKDAINEKSRQAEIIVCSPYAAMKNEETTTMNSIQGKTCDILILELTNSEITKFILDDNRLTVAMSRSRCLTIITGRVESLKRNSKLFKSLTTWPTRDFIEFLESAEVIKIVKSK